MKQLKNAISNELNILTKKFKEINIKIWVKIKIKKKWLFLYKFLFFHKAKNILKYKKNKKNFQYLI